MTAAPTVSVPTALDLAVGHLLAALRLYRLASPLGRYLHGTSP